jgi:ferrochelatase
MTRPKTAIVLFNLGAPDAPAAVWPFLLNLFRDPAILRVPFFVRPFLAWLIARQRVATAAANYALLGGGSPLLEQTRRQGEALAAALPELEARCFVAMRYWHPMSATAAAAVAAWGPDEIVLLPLYPQYSSTTTGSSLAAWREAAARAGLARPVTTVCCYYAHPDFVAATAAGVRRSYEAARAALPATTPLRLLFSAHGLPEAVVAAGDPYQAQVEQTVAAVVAKLGLEAPDAVICYQSRATRQRWIGPATEEEIARAARDRTAVLVIPIAFVSEHSETLIELDVDYRRLAERLGVPGYFRVPTQGTDPAFIAALAAVVRAARRHGPGLLSCGPAQVCPRRQRACPHAAAIPAKALCASKEYA